jgi:hypothetical protein
MKAITLILLVFILSCVSKKNNTIAQTNTDQHSFTLPKIVFESNSRGFFHSITLENDTITSSKIRGEKGSQFQLSSDEMKTIQMELEKIEFVKIPTLEAPSEKRFYDAAPITYLEIIEKDKSYKTPEFDGGYPPKYIQKLVLTILAIVEKK